MPSSHLQPPKSPLAAPFARTLRAALSLAVLISTLNQVSYDGARQLRDLSCVSAGQRQPAAAAVRHASHPDRAA